MTTKTAKQQTANKKVFAYADQLAAKGTFSADQIAAIIWDRFGYFVAVKNSTVVIQNGNGTPLHTVKVGGAVPQPSPNLKQYQCLCQICGTIHTVEADFLAVSRYRCAPDNVVYPLLSCGHHSPEEVRAAWDRAEGLEKRAQSDIDFYEAQATKDLL